MKATQKLHDMGQSLWLDNITRALLTSGTLRRYIQEFAVTGLTSNPTIFDHAIKNSHDYDDAFADHGEIGQTLPTHARYCDDVLAKFMQAGIDTDALAAQLQDEGAKAFVKSWNELLASIASKGIALKKAG